MGEEEAEPFDRTPLTRTILMFTYLITASLFAFLTLCSSDTSLNTCTGIAQRGLHSPRERALALFAPVFLSTVLLGLFQHSRLLALPFPAPVACRESGRD